jgi:hypothetical protein
LRTRRSNTLPYTYASSYGDSDWNTNGNADTERNAASYSYAGKLTQVQGRGPPHSADTAALVLLNRPARKIPVSRSSANKRSLSRIRLTPVERVE